MFSGLLKSAGYGGSNRELPVPASKRDPSEPREDSVRSKKTLAALYQGIKAENLTETAACLKREAGLEDDYSFNEGMTSEDILRVLLEPGMLPSEAATALRDFLGNQRHSPSLTLATAHSHMQEQQSNIDRLHAKMRSLKESAQTTMPTAISAGGGQDRLKELSLELENADAEVAQLQSELKEKQENEQLLRQRLKQAKEAEAARPAPKPLSSRRSLNGKVGQAVSSREADQLRRIIGQWDTPMSATRRSATKCFAHVDADHDGRLTWNNDEIRSFVRSIFKHFQIALPPWQDPVWYEMYRRCDLDNNYSLDLEEALHFAKICLETALSHLVT